jgi:hypothetical protein
MTLARRPLPNYQNRPAIKLAASHQALLRVFKGRRAKIQPLVPLGAAAAFCAEQQVFIGVMGCLRTDCLSNAAV